MVALGSTNVVGVVRAVRSECPALGHKYPAAVPLSHFLLLEPRLHFLLPSLAFTNFAHLV